MKDKVAIVTGGASGIGLAAAEALCAAGCKVIIADMNRVGGMSAAATLGCQFMHVDLTTQKGCRGLVGGAMRVHGSVDILVNNAGIQHVSPIGEFPTEKWDLIISLMLTAPFLLAKYCWPIMQKNGWGRIININSVHGLVASPYKVAYVAAKHGLTGMTKTLALEGGEQGITVNDICPAYVDTPLVQNQIADQATCRGIPETDVIEQIMLKNSAVKRMVKPSEIGSMVTYLCGDAASCITGSSITIDGGWTAT